jgi:hypothetical protein
LDSESRRPGQPKPPGAQRVLVGDEARRRQSEAGWHAPGPGTDPSRLGAGLRARSALSGAGRYFRWLVGFGVADVSGDTAGFTGVTFDHVAAIATMAASRAMKIPMRTRRFMARL